MPSYIQTMEAFRPTCAQEKKDQETILWYAKQFPDTVLLRDNPIAHITSSGFLMNRALNRVLMVHHNIRNTWAWTGGHADGDEDLLAVAIREAIEETGISHAWALSPDIASMDILHVYGHVKNGQYVNAHLHLSVAYILLCDEADPLFVKPDENSGVQWFAVEDIRAPLYSERDIRLYGKLARWAGQHA